MVRMFRKPLVIMTPKSLLRNKDATSPLIEFTRGEFRTVIGEVESSVDASKVKRVICCSGKVYYDLVKKRADKKAVDTAIVRVEQLYPFPHKAFAAELKKYPNLSELVWCQDEPQNQGAWFFVQHYIHENMAEGQKLGYAGRPASASPAVGYAHLHQEQQKRFAGSGIRQAQGLRSQQVRFVRFRRACDPSRMVGPSRAPDGAGQASSDRNRRYTSWQSLKSRFLNCPSRWPKPPCCSGRRRQARCRRRR
jgi:hypothetical protein